MAASEAAARRAALVVASQGDRRSPSAPLLLWLPAGLVAAAILLPITYLIGRAIGAGAESWALLFRARTLEIFLHTAALSLLVTGAAAAISIPLAWLTVRTDLPHRRLWSVLTVLPLVIPTYVGGFLLVAALGPRGMVQQLLSGPFGIERLPEIYGFPGAVLALTLFTYPYMLLSVRAGLRGLDPALEEASLSLGHGPRATFWRVTMPHLRPSIAGGALLVALYTLSDFGAVSLLQFNSFTRAIYLQYQGSLDRSGAALLSLLLVLLTAVILLAEARTRGRGRYHGSAGAIRQPRPVRLGRWLWPSLAFCSLVVLLALVLPILILVYWLLRGVAQGVGPGVIWGAALNSSYASGLAALGAVAAALPVVVLSVRYPGKLAALLERATYAGFALPGIVVALALVFFGANYLTPLYQTLSLMVVAYVVRFLPQAIGTTRASLLQVSPSLEEAARSLGRSHLQLLATITIPLLRPGILAGFALVFLTTMKELPITLLLSPIGFKTLATTIWTATAEGFFAEAAPPALLLVLISGVSVALLLRWEGRVRGE